MIQRCPQWLCCSIFGNSRVYVVRPGEDAAAQVFQVGEALLLEEDEGLGGADAATAHEDNFLIRVEVVEAGGEGSERDEGRARDLGDGQLGGFADIYQLECFAPLLFGFQFGRRDFGYRCLHNGC
jgi:hypothetical protein